MKLNQFQTFILVLALLVASLVLFMVDQSNAAMLCLGAVLGAAAPTSGIGPSPDAP